MTDVVVRRRAGLMAAVALLSGGLAVAYAWRSDVDHDGTAALIAALLGVVAVGHAKAWRAAREPLLIADSTGIRLRLGSGWTGLQWESVERIEVVERRRVRDGQVVIVAKPEAAALARSGVRARVAAALNRQLYDESLVVPFGLSTSVTVVDLASSLDRLAAGRAAVLLVGRLEDAPEPTVEITSSESGTHVNTDIDVDLPVERSQAASRLHPARASTVATTVGRLRQGVFTARATSPGDLRQVAATVTPAARREEITISPRTQPATAGGLALSEPIEVPAVADLPEAAELRRRDRSDTDRDLSGGNVSLIIDATTDLSARAMQRVRRAEAARTGRTSSETVAEVDYGAVIGGELASARLRNGMAIDELAARTRIRPYVIESIEIDDFSPCGGDFYARGHIRMLAHAVGLDAAPLVTAYEQHFATSPVNPRDVFEVELARGSSGLLRGGERSSNWAALVAAVLALVMVWAVARYLTNGSLTTLSLTQPTTSAAGLGSPGPGNPPVHGPRTAHVKVSVAGGESRVVVKDRFKRTVFSGLLSDGDQRKVHGEAPLRVRATDGGVVSLRSSGRPLGVMGDGGEPARERIAARPPTSNPPTRQLRPGSGGVSTTE
jgi:cytoskeleton protein RodZ